MGLPVSGLRISTAILLEHALDQEGHHVNQAHCLLLGIGEAGDRLILDDTLAARRPYVAERRRSMAYGTNHLALGKKAFNERGRVLILRQIPQGTMSAGVKHGVVVAQAVASGIGRCAFGKCQRAL
jgi:hypothetical protein